MAWEEIRTKLAGRNKGVEWQVVPCVAVNKSGLSFNTAAVKAFGIQSGSYIRVLFDTSRRVLGFKRCVDGEPIMGAYKVSVQSHGKNRGTDTFSIKCEQIAKRCPDCLGKAYRAQLNAGERVIEVLLGSENTI